MNNSSDLEIHERVKFNLRMKQSSLAKLSRELGVSCGAVALVSRGRKRSRRIERAIAEKLSTTPEALYPSRYAKKEDRS